MGFTKEAAGECGPGCLTKAEPEARLAALGRALSLEYITVGWNVVEGIAGVTTALLAGSVALLGFGIDSFIECASALVIAWRLRAERDRRLDGQRLDIVERGARRLVGGLLFLLAVYVVVDAAGTLRAADRPSFSLGGVLLMIVSAAVMLWLARAKRRLARTLGSEAMEADAFQTTACWWLSLSALTGVGLNGLFGWWWADPMAAFVVAGLIVREGRAAWRGRRCAC